MKKPLLNICFILLLTFVVQDLIAQNQLPDLPTAIEISYPKSNPLKDALLEVPATAVFEMEGWSLWDPSVIKVGDTYHLFCSRWKDDEGWKTWMKSHIIRATSKSLFGPYTFEEVVMTPQEHPWANMGLHNPKIIKIGDRFLIYHLAIPQWKTGFLFADKIEGPWTPSDSIMVYTNNPAMMIREDGSAYVVGKFKLPNHSVPKDRFVYMNAFEAKSIDGPFEKISGNKNCLPGGFELEDPTIWWTNNQYNVICTDWKAKVTGSEKSVLMYTSKNGLDYTLYSQIPLWTKDEPLPVEGWGNVMPIKVERPQVYINKEGKLAALLVSAVKQSQPNKGIILIRPVKNFIPSNK